MYKQVLEELSCRNCGGKLRREHMPEKDEGYGYECTKCKVTYSPIEIIDLYEERIMEIKGQMHNFSIDIDKFFKQ
jgi:methionyl-tRNA synthetase